MTNGDNTLAYYNKEFIAALNVYSTGAYPIKLFTTVIYELS